MLLLVRNKVCSLINPSNIDAREIAVVILYIRDFWIAGLLATKLSLDFSFN